MSCFQEPALDARGIVDVHLATVGLYLEPHLDSVGMDRIDRVTLSHHYTESHEGEPLSADGRVRLLKKREALFMIRREDFI
jgi:hypothetical protein